ncbi:MAG: prephenate dehydrogenase/arogenate dehydrogenase family protein [Rhizobiaceae bacterium]
MGQVVKKLAVIGQGLIGSSITRAAVERGVVSELVVTDNSDKVRRRVRELGLGEAKVVDTSAEAVADADLVVICVPVGQIAKVAAEVAPVMKAGAILSDVGSVKASVVAEILPVLPHGIHLVPAHPLAGTEQSGPEAGLPSLFINRWCILTPPDGTDPSAVEKAKQFWEALGSKAEIMTPEHHDYVLSITSHLPHVAAYSIFHTALKYERETNSDVVKFSAGGFRDFTRIASSNPAMWRDIFLGNKVQVLDILRRFMGDLDEFANAIEAEDGEKLEKLLSTSRLTRRKVIEKEHISLQPKPDSLKSDRALARPYSSDF